MTRSRSLFLSFNTYEHWEGLIIKVQGNSLSKTFTIGNIYRSPRTRNEDLKVFIDEFTPILSRLDNCNNDIIIAGDFNINLLKLNENDMFSSFFDTVISHSLYPQITLPTRFTRTNRTLIDNLFCRLHKSILENTAGILTKRFSDHQPYFMIMHNTEKLHPPS